MTLISSLLVTLTIASAAARLASSRISGSRTSPFSTTAADSRSATWRARVALSSIRVSVVRERWAAELLGEKQADIAAAGDHDPLGHLLLVAERPYRPRSVAGLDHRVDLVAGDQMVVAGRHEQMAVPDDADAGQMEVREQEGQLAQRRVEDRAVGAAARRDQAHPILGERRHLGRARHLEPAGDRAGDLELGRDDHVDRHMLAPEQVLPAALQIALVAHPGDLGRDVEQRVGDLAGDHVDLVGIGHRDQELGVPGAGLLEHLGMRGKAGDRLDVQALTDLLGQLLALIDHRDVIAGAGQVAGDVVTDLPGAADNDLHPPGLPADRRRARLSHRQRC